VNLEKTIKSIQRELRTNPKKALLLTLLLVGAGYFWLPIARRWAGGTTSVAKGAAPPILTDDVRPNASNGKKAAKLPAWDLLTAAMSQDKLTASADLTELTRNPFFVAALEMAQESQPEPEEAPPPPEPIVIDAGKVFTVKSVVVGPGGRTAVVNGEVLREGDPLVHSVKDSETEYTVAAIETWGITIKREDKTWDLKIDQPQLHHRDRIVRGEVRGRAEIKSLD
jgi:hypothetical protein